MTDITDEKKSPAEATTMDSPQPQEALPPARVTFRGIVEDGDSDSPLTSPTSEAVLKGPIGEKKRNWNALSRQVWLASRLFAIMIFSAITSAWLVGAHWSHRELYGTSSGWLDTLQRTLDVGTIFLTIFVPLLILLCGYLLSHAYKMLNAAQSIANTAQQFIHPDQSAIVHAQSVGHAVRDQVEALNTGVDDALQRLAHVEAIIRTHVQAIETAGSTIQEHTTDAVGKVAVERSRLIELTENLNAQADAFAAAIAERAQASIEAINNADQQAGITQEQLEDRLSRLQQAAAKAVESFEALSNAVNDADQHMLNTAEAVEQSAQKVEAASDHAARQSADAVSALENNAGQLGDALSATTDDLIEKAKSEQARLAEESLEDAKSQSGNFLDSARKTLEEIKSATKSVIDGAVDDAQQASKQAEEMRDAAQLSSQSALDAAKDLKQVSEEAKANSEELRQRAQEQSLQMDERSAQLASAREALKRENDRLEFLIDEQKKRADRLADAIASQTERLSRLASEQTQPPLDPTQEEDYLDAEAGIPPRPEHDAGDDAKTPVTPVHQLAPVENGRDHQTGSALDGAPITGPAGHERLEELARDIASRNVSSPASPPTDQNGSTNIDKEDVSWRQILSNTDDAEPLSLTPQPAPAVAEAPIADAVTIIKELQDFTLELEHRLYGTPPAAMQERFDKGERNVFASRIIRLNEADVKRRIRSESAKDKAFEAKIHQFLQGFESLLEDATTSQTADEELEEYLSSPLGRVYLLIGATVGYFA